MGLLDLIVIGKASVVIETDLPEEQSVSNLYAQVGQAVDDLREAADTLESAKVETTDAGVRIVDSNGNTLYEINKE